jgi:phenylalanine-4-hydroxylase
LYCDSAKPFYFNQNGALYGCSDFCFSGPADVNSFDLISHLPSKTIKAKHSERDDLEILYQTVRNTRVTNDTNVISSNFEN